MPLSLVLSLGALVIVNLLPLAGAIFWGWSVLETLFLFWAENVVIGLFNVARMMTLLVARGEKRALFTIPFFIVHYGGFAVGHVVFLLSMFGPNDSGQAQTAAEGSGGAELLLPFLALCGSHLISFLVNFLWAGEYKRVTPDRLMFAPYARVVALHLTILLGAMAVQALNHPAAALALLVLLKTLIDAAAHVHEHLTLARPAAPRPVERQPVTLRGDGSAPVDRSGS